MRDLVALGRVLAAWLRVNTHGTTCETAAARLLAADLPPGARGTLVLEFRPPGFATCLAVSAGSASLLLLLGLARALLAARRRRGGAPIGPVPGP